MSNSFLEIVELEDGVFALQKMDSDEEPLVVIQFSEEIGEMLKDKQAVIAKAMIGAGVQTAGSISRSVMENEEQQEQNRTLH